MGSNYVLNELIEGKKKSTREEDQQLQIIFVEITPFFIFFYWKTIKLKNMGGEETRNAVRVNVTIRIFFFLLIENLFFRVKKIFLWNNFYTRF